MTPFPGISKVRSERYGASLTFTAAPQPLLPTHWETHEGLKYDGVGWYEKTIELPELPAGRRLLLHCQNGRKGHVRETFAG